MAKPVVIRPEAEREAREAMAWYRDRSEQAASHFRDELHEAFHAIGVQPERFPVYHGTYRYRLLHRFPFRIIYRECEAHIEIIAVAHTSRRPDYWKQR